MQPRNRSSVPYLLRLYHVKRELDQNEAKLSVVRSEFVQALEQEQSLESTIQAEKAEAAVLQRDVGKAEKEQAKRRERLEALAPGKIKEEQGLKARQEKLKAEKEAGMSMREDLLQQKERKKGLAEDIAKLEATEQELQIKQAEALEEMRASGVTLSEAKLQEYNKLKQQVSAQCQEGKARLQALVRQQEADKTEAAVQERELSLHLATKESAARDIEQQSAKTQQLSADLQKRAKESEVRAEMKGLEDQQRAYRQERKQSQHEEKMAAALEIMKDMYPGVKGRLVDLCREQRVGVADFIPLSGIKDKSPNERYRALGEAFRLAVDVIECEDEIRPAVAYAVGPNTVICDSLDDARHLCFRKNEKVKAVTLSGSVIAKDGTMTGGKVEEAGGGRKGGGGTTGRWDAQDMRTVKEKLEALEAEAKEISRGRSKQALADKSTALNQLRSRLATTDQAVAFCQSRIKELTVQLQAAEKAAGKVQTAQDALSARVSTRQKEMQEVRTSMEAVEDKIFAAFCKALSLKNIREYEERELKAMREWEEKLASLRDHRDKLRAQLDYEEGRDFEEPLRKAIEKVKALKAEIKTGEDSLASLHKKEEGLKEAMQEAEATLAEAKSLYEEKQKLVRGLTKKRTSSVAARTEIASKITHEESALERIRARIHDILQKARVDEVDLPMLDNAEEGEDGEEDGEESEETESEAGSGMKKLRGSTSTASSSFSGGGEASTHPSHSQAPRIRKDRKELDKINFSSLPKKEKVAKARDELETTRKRYHDRIADLQGEVEKMQPNMRALEKYEEMSRRVKEVGKSIVQGDSLGSPSVSSRSKSPFPFSLVSRAFFLHPPGGRRVRGGQKGGSGEQCPLFPPATRPIRKVHGLLRARLGCPDQYLQGLDEKQQAPARRTGLPLTRRLRRALPRRRRLQRHAPHEAVGSIQAFMHRHSRPRCPPAFCAPLIRLPFACCPPFPVQVPGHGTAFGRRKNSRCPGLTFRHPLLQTSPLFRAGRGGRRPRQRERP
ncbi:cohesin complex subunit [Nannochloropsis gaditana]|uniref:Cohesin complex subunit n=1 Tax=Nannochloropsis gaditana TaxID=72520 RepID=W7T006_9STRA|nr:cohesin complex subunit [Nannochloropsis gaditana]